VNRKLATLLAGVVAASAALLAVHPSDAAPVVQAQSVFNGHVYMFRDAQALGGVDWASPLNGIPTDCNNVPFFRWAIPYPARITVSSIQVQTVGDTPHCNAVGVYSSLSQVWFFACVGQYWKGYDFGWGPGGYFNDRIGYVDLRYSSGCGLYN
jgi:hypothetical protein